MNRLQRGAILAMLVDALRAHNSWAGETHVQKAAFLLQDAAKVPLGYDFVLYKHGPYSFELRNELEELTADGLLASVPQSPPYGPRLRVTELGKKNVALRGKTANRYTTAVNNVTDFLNDRGVSTLERIATAFLYHEKSPESPDEDIAEQVVRVKPHVSRFDALTATREIRTALPGLEASVTG